MQVETVKFVVFVPETHAAAVRKALGDAGAGREGAYSHCSFSVKGTGRFTPLEGAHPFIGKPGVPEEVVEERIETICYKKDIKKIIEAMKKAHPYERPAYEVYLLYSP
jgi:hypothetical protein